MYLVGVHEEHEMHLVGVHEVGKRTCWWKSKQNSMEDKVNIYHQNTSVHV